MAPSCGPVTAAASEVVLLVHGFYPSLWADPVTWLREFYDIKDRVLEQEYSCQRELRKNFRGTRRALTVNAYLSAKLTCKS